MNQVRSIAAKSASTARLMGSVSMAALVALGASVAQAAPAATATAADTVETIVVTGTSIRGVAPVGSSLVAVGQDAIQKTAATTPQPVRPGHH